MRGIDLIQLSSTVSIRYFRFIAPNIVNISREGTINLAIS